MPWAALRARFPALSPAQLHRLLTQYQLAAAIGPVSAWDPGPQDSPDAFTPEDVLESYENPPPIVLPSEGFKVDLEADCLDDSVYQQLLHIRHFLWSLRSQARPKGLQAPQHANSYPDGDPGDLPEPRSRGPCEAQGPPGRTAGLGGSQVGREPGDASCLLTPPSTPLGLEAGTQDWPLLLERQRNGLGGPRGMAPEGNAAAPLDEHPRAPSSRSPSPEGSGYVFAVELERGPSGLGLGLIDGMHTPLGVPGLYIQTLLPGSPAACDGRLSLGDCILEVNGASLRGLGYLRAVELIRHGGKKMQFLVARSAVETAKKTRPHTPPS